MTPAKFENAIIIRSETRLEQLEKQFNTKTQAAFYIQRQKEIFVEKKMKKAAAKMATSRHVEEQEIQEVKNDFKKYETEHDQTFSVIEKVKKYLAKNFRIKEVLQPNLPYHIFSKKDLIIVIGQDGLVANTAKYVKELPIIAINPLPNIFDGILLPFKLSDFRQGVEDVVKGDYRAENITMAQVELNDGQQLWAFNDFFVGINSHASARYEIEFEGKRESQSSSGIIISTGAGSTGWLSSVYNMARAVADFNGLQNFRATSQFGREEKFLRFVVREPFVSKHSQANIVVGDIRYGSDLIIESKMPENGIIFSDGVQHDFLQFNSGSIATFSLAKEKAQLVRNTKK